MKGKKPKSRNRLWIWGYWRNHFDSSWNAPSAVRKYIWRRAVIDNVLFKRYNLSKSSQASISTTLLWWIKVSVRIQWNICDIILVNLTKTLILYYLPLRIDHGQLIVSLALHQRYRILAGYERGDRIDQGLTHFTDVKTIILHYSPLWIYQRQLIISGLAKTMFFFFK